MNAQWDRFTETGKILDYLSYKGMLRDDLPICSATSCTKGEGAYAANDRGSGHS